MKLYHVRNNMFVVENRFNNNEFFADTADTTENDVKQNRKKECLKEPINKREAFAGTADTTEKKCGEAKEAGVFKGINEQKESICR